MLSVIITALMCHAVPVSDGSATTCKRETVWTGEQSPMVCNSAQMIIAQWKGLSKKYESDEWVVAEYDCGAGR